jgi:hypothetical protein
MHYDFFKNGKKKEEKMKKIAWLRNNNFIDVVLSILSSI